MKKYIVRLDDISWDMNYENYERIKDLLKKYDVRPLIGVIPNNEDESLKEFVREKKIGKDCFWEEIRNVQGKEGWCVALHGYNHVYLTKDGGIFHINPRAEFAGLTYEKQNEKIKRGKLIFENEKIRIDAFMAPGHSLDWITVEALLNNEIRIVTDGFSYFPYKENGIWFVPQTSPWFRKGLIGVDTVCLHVNSWNDDHFDRLESFLRKNANKCIDFSEITNKISQYDKTTYLVLNRMSKVIIPLENKLRRIASRVLLLVRKK